jgi:hypothetical protein
MAYRSASEAKSLFISLSTCYKRNIHSVNLVGFIHINFRENGMLLDAHSVVASSVEALVGNSLEVASSEVVQDSSVCQGIHT